MKTTGKKIMGPSITSEYKSKDKISVKINQTNKEVLEHCVAILFTAGESFYGSQGFRNDGPHK